MRDAVDDADGDPENSRPDHHQSEVRLAQLADRQLGLISLEQLYELGFTYAQVRWRLHNGRLHRLHHNVFAVGHTRVTGRAHLFAALLSLGPRAFLSHRTAAAVHGLRPINIHDIQLTVPGTGGRRRPGITVHRTAREPHRADVRIQGELRVSAVPAMLIELAPHETAAELERLVTLAVRRRLLRPDAADGRAEIDAALARHHRCPHTTRVRAVLAVYLRTDSSASELERAFDRFLARHPELPEPQRNVDIGGWEIDRYWPAHRLVVELDGRPYHVAARDMERDRLKDAALQRLGHIPIRITDLRFDHDRPGVLRDLRHFLGIDGG